MTRKTRVLQAVTITIALSVAVCYTTHRFSRRAEAAEVRDRDKVAKVKCDWGTWDAAGTNMVVSGLAWQGLHRCTVSRPTWAVGKSCLDLPNETWGGENGITWGDMVLTHGGVPYFTGVVSNTADRVVARFDNGYLVELTPYN